MGVAGGGGAVALELPEGEIEIEEALVVLGGGGGALGFGGGPVFAEIEGFGDIAAHGTVEVAVIGAAEAAAGPLGAEEIKN